MEEYILEAMKYFETEDWLKLDGSEQLKYGQITYIYFACIHLGIKAVAPEFMYKHEKVENEVPTASTEEKKLIFLCEYCDSTFALKEHVVKHRKVCKKRFDFIKKKTYACDKCNYSTDRLENLQRHKQTMHSNKRKYSCNLCPKTFKQSRTLNKHINNIHLHVESYKCSRCSYKTTHKGNLARHLNKHVQVEKGLYACTECPYRTSVSADLVKHMNVHIRIDVETLIDNVKQKSQHKCNECDFVTDEIFILENHLYSHSTNRPFICSICNFQCSCNSILYQHMKTKHGA